MLGSQIFPNIMMFLNIFKYFSILSYFVRYVQSLPHFITLFDCQICLTLQIKKFKTKDLSTTFYWAWRVIYICIMLFGSQHFKLAFRYLVSKTSYFWDLLYEIWYRRLGISTFSKTCNIKLALACKKIDTFPKYSSTCHFLTNTCMLPYL